MGNGQIKNKKNTINSANNIINVFLIIFISVCLIITIRQGFSGQPLWLDESMLMDSVLNRDFVSLGATPLDFSQNAPFGYLYIVKILTIIFGSSENVLRLFSVFSVIGIVILSYLITKSVSNTRFALLCAAFISSMGLLIRYAAEAKPYASDAFFVLICIWIYSLYKADKIKYWVIVVSYAAIVWFSFAASFFIAGIMILEFTFIILQYSKKLIKFNDFAKQVLLALLVPVSFLLCYFLWLKPSMDYLKLYNDYYATDYWGQLNFPLIPTGRESVNLALKMTERIISRLGDFAEMLFVGSLFGLVISIKKRIPELVGTYISMFIMLVVSYFGKFPVEVRLMLFVYPIMIISFFLAGFHTKPFIDKILESKVIKSVVNVCMVGFLAVVLFINFTSVIKSTQQPINRVGAVNDTHINYIQTNIDEDEKVYVFFYNIPSYLHAADFQFEYRHFQDEPILYEDVILGSFFAVSNIDKPYEYNWELDTSMMNLDLEMINSGKSVYLIVPDSGIPERDIITAFLDELDKMGDLEHRYYSNCTNIYHYTYEN